MAELDEIQVIEALLQHREMMEGTGERTTFEDFIELSEVQQKIFDEVKAEWEKQVGKGNISEGRLKRMILMADIDGDGKKRVVVDGKTHLVPISDIILHGLQAVEIDKYPVVEEDENEKTVDY